MQNSLTRLVGSHASLLGMASYMILSGPSAAFAATTATQNVSLTVNVGSSISITQTAAPSTMKIVGGGTTSSDGTYEVITNNSPGYSVNILGTNGGCSKILCSGSNSMPDKTAWTQGTPNATVQNGASNLGLMFRVKQTGTLAGLYNTTYWGADDTPAIAKWAGIPTTAQLIATKASLSTGDDFIVTFRADPPVAQPSGAYTNATPIYITAVTL